MTNDMSLKSTTGMPTIRPELGKTCVEIINPDIADIADINDVYCDGATMRPDYLKGGLTIGDVVPPGWTIRDAAMVALCRAGKGNVKCALGVENAHARAEAIDACGGWDQILSEPAVKDEEGELFRTDWLETAILKLTCPSTGQVYHLHVPAEMKTPTEARDWVNRGVKTEMRS